MIYILKDILKKDIKSIQLQIANTIGYLFCIHCTTCSISHKSLGLQSQSQSAQPAGQPAGQPEEKQEEKQEEKEEEEKEKEEQQQQQQQTQEEFFNFNFYFKQEEFKVEHQILCHSCDKAGSSNYKSTSYVSLSLLKPFLKLLATNQDINIRSSMTISFYRILRHIIPNELNKSNNIDIASITLSLLFDDHEYVRKQAANSIALLLDNQLYTGPLISLFIRNDDEVKNHEIACNKAITTFINIIKEKNHQNLNNIHIYTALANLACKLPLSSRSQCNILWNLINGMINTNYNIRAISYNEINKIAKCFNINTAELIERHKSILYPQILEQTYHSPALVLEICEGLLDMDCKEFIKISTSCVTIYYS